MGTDAPQHAVDAEPEREPAPWCPRFARVDRFPTSCSALSALSQLELLGIAPGDIRLVLEGRYRSRWPQILEQHPAPGHPLRHGAEVQLHLALQGLHDVFPEGLFVTLPGRAGREQLDSARRLCAPFDKERLLALSRLRFWNTVFSGAHRSDDFDAFLFRILGLSADSLQRARRVFDPEGLRAWTRILPLLWRVVGDVRHVTHILERFLGDRIELDVGPHQVQAVPEACRLQLRQGPALGCAYVGARVREDGTVASVRIGPLAPERTRAYRRVPLAPASGASGAALVTELGPVCEFWRHWRTWERSESEPHGAQSRPYETRWPLLVYLLEHLLPATLTVRVHLQSAPTEGWRLGSTPGDGKAGQALPSGASVGEPSTLGTTTVLARPAGSAS